jgi:putative transposase
VLLDIGASTRLRNPSSALKKERIKKRIYKNRDEATADISDYIDTFYNQTRRHSHLGGVSPAEFEAAAKGHRAVH